MVSAIILEVMFILDLVSVEDSGDSAVAGLVEEASGENGDITMR